jgi:plasmid stabilization system protein ParE
MAEVRWTTQSIEDINNIAEFIAKDSIRYAEIQVEEFFDSAVCLEEFPKTGRIVPEVGDNSLRELIVGFYRIIYRIKSTDKVDVLTVYHTKRILTKKKIKSLK